MSETTNLHLKKIGSDEKIVTSEYNENLDKIDRNFHEISASIENMTAAILGKISIVQLPTYSGISVQYAYPQSDLSTKMQTTTLTNGICKDDLPENFKFLIGIDYATLNQRSDSTTPLVFNSPRLIIYTKIKKDGGWMADYLGEIYMNGGADYLKSNYYVNSGSADTMSCDIRFPMKGIEDGKTYYYGADMIFAII